MIGIIGIFEIAIGAALQYFFTKFLEEKRHQRNLRTEAYLDFLKGVSEQGSANFQGNKIFYKKYMIDFVMLGQGCCYMGPPKVIQKFAEFNKLGGWIRTREERSLYTACNGNETRFRKQQ